MRTPIIPLFCALLFIFALVVYSHLNGLVVARAGTLSFIAVAFPWIWLFVCVALLFATIVTVWK